MEDIKLNVTTFKKRIRVVEDSEGKKSIVDLLEDKEELSAESASEADIVKLSQQVAQYNTSQRDMALSFPVGEYNMKEQIITKK